ncbi:MAG: ferritin-like domain-containing protein, partial [Myxococcota bacterium]
MNHSALLMAILAGLSAAGCSTEETTMCMSVADDAETCPAAEDVDVEMLSSPDTCDLEASKVLGEGSLESGIFDIYIIDTAADPSQACCYPVRAVDTDLFSECMIGRPYVEDAHAPVVAPLANHNGWCVLDEPGEAVDGSLADAWLAVAQMEHASIAAFARLTLDLMACGAPAHLIADVQQAAADEVRHAQACFAIAARLSGQPRSPGAMPFTAPVVPCTDLVTLAVAATREGCMGETLGAALAVETARRTQDPAIKATLETIAADETRHAALSWRIVAWAI